MSEDIHRQLQQKLHTFSIGFPATADGVELEILRYLFNEDDAALFMTMSHKVEDAATHAARAGRPVEQVAAQLADMTSRGLLFRLVKDGVPLYGAIPFIHGLMEFQVKRVEKPLAELVVRYSRSPEFMANFAASAQGFLRPIPVQQAVPVAHQVASYDDAAALLAQAKQIVVTDCICRKQMELVGEGCGKAMEACFMFGSMGQYYLDHDMGRKIELDEALAILRKCQEDGLVNQPGTAQNPAGMCNCCGDCCGVLRSLKSLPNPGEVVYSNHMAALDADECIGCETCLDRCQMGAITMGEGIAVIEARRCIGCGLCVTTCPTEAIGLEPKAEQIMPPKTSSQQMAHIAELRGRS